MRKRKALTPEQKEFLKDRRARMLKIDETCALLGETRSTFYRRHPLAKQVVKIGRSSFWSMKTIEDWIEKQSNVA
jgi:predicted DNA-binding transcriptional regulator AlpA